MRNSISPSRNRCRTILYVDTGVGLAGGQFSLFEILRFLDSERYAALVCSPPDSAIQTECRKMGIAWRSIPFASIHRSGPNTAGVKGRIRDVGASVKGVRKLLQHIRHDRVDIVHANTFKAALVGSLACILTSRPLIFHDRIHVTHGLLGWFVALVATRIIAVSGSVGSKHGAMVRSKVRVIPSGIDTVKLRTVRTEPGPPRICYLGRISEEKGLERLIDSAPMVLKEIPDTRFVIAGAPFTPRDEAHLDGLRRRTRALGLDDRFEFPGYVRDIITFYGSCDVLVLPSRKEPLGRVMLEAMAAKKPVIAYDTGGPAEVISDGETGILVEPGSVTGLADAVISLLKDADLRRRLGENACRVVAEGFASDKIAARIMEVYDEIGGR